MLMGPNCKNNIGVGTPYTLTIWAVWKPSLARITNVQLNKSNVKLNGFRQKL